MVKFRYSKENFYNCHFIGDLSLAERAARINELKRLTPDEVEMADKLSNIITLEHWPDWENAVYKTRYENGIPHFSLFFHAERRKAVGINDNLLSLGKEPLFPSNSDEEESEDEEEPVLAAVQSNTSRKRKRQDQDDPAEKKARLYRKMGEFKFKKDELDCRFEFEHPKGKQLWDSMKAFPRFLDGDLEYNVGDIAIIHYRNKIFEGENAKKAKVAGEHREPENFWLAQILKFKRISPSECLVLIAWLYWPEELDKAIEKNQSASKWGRRGYHGQHELIASNHLQDVSTRSLNGNFTNYIVRLDENADGKIATQYYYRQSFDIRTRTLSELLRYCTCMKYQRPGSILLQCPSKTCALWHHQECIIDKYCMNAYLAKQDKMKKKPGNIYRPKSLDPNSVARAVGPTQKLWKKWFAAEIKADFKTIVVEDLDPLHKGFFEPETIKCLGCGTAFT